MSQVYIFVVFLLFGLSHCQLDFYNLTFTQTNITPSYPRICLFPPNQSTLSGCDYAGYALALARDAIAPIVVTGVFALLLLIFLLASCCTPFIKVKWCKMCFKLNVFIRLALLVIPLLFFLAGFGLIFAQHFTSQVYYENVNNEMEVITLTLTNLSDTVAFYANDSRINNNSDFNGFQSQIDSAINDYGIYSSKVKDALHYTWIARTTVSFFAAGFSLIIALLAFIALGFSTRIVFMIYALFSIVLLISVLLVIASAEIMFLLFRDVCKEVTYTNGAINLFQNSIADPINSAISLGNEIIVNMTSIGCSTVSNLVSCCSAPLECCGNLTSPICNNVTLPSFGLKAITDVVADGGNGLVWTIDQCVTSCAGGTEVNGSTAISTTGFTITAVTDLQSSGNMILAEFGNKFSNLVYASTCSTPYVAELFAAGGLFLSGSILFTLFLTVLFDRWGANNGSNGEDDL